MDEYRASMTEEYSREQAQQEQEPGVYVRSNRPSQELDFLWDRERKKQHDGEKSHIGFFAGGFLLGTALTFAGCVFLMPNKTLVPQQAATVSPTVIQDRTPVSSNAVTASPDVEKNEAPAPVKSAPKKEGGFRLPFMPAPEAKTEPTEQASSPTPKIRYYQVQPNDTLGSIAIKFYESSSPEYVEKIQRANKMENADTLQLGQTLSIPPKSY